MEGWNELWSFEDIEAVQQAALQTLQEYGINVPRGESMKLNRPLGGATIFGVSLDCGQQPTLTHQYGDCGEFKLPRFFVEAVQFLEEQSSRQGIFRKAGSVSRQKALRAALDSGNSSIPEDANVHDVASLFKQYLRELPEPLITSHLLPVFQACYTLPSPADRQRCILLACLLLPQVHLQCLCVLMKLLRSVSEVAKESLMDASNLGIVLAPSLMKPPQIDIFAATQNNNLLKSQAGIVQLLIESAQWIGYVPGDVYRVSEPVKEDIVCQAHSEEEGEEDNESERHSPPKVDTHGMQEEEPAQNVQEEEEERASSMVNKQQTSSSSSSSSWTGSWLLACLAALLVLLAAYLMYT